MTVVSADLRRLVTERAAACCEYCLLAQTSSFFKFHIDHIIAVKHRGQTEPENLCLSCPDCNISKGSDLASVDPETGRLTYLFHPRKQPWNSHFALNGAIIQPLTAVGRVTVHLLRFNDPDRIYDRETFISLNQYPCNRKNEIS